MHQTLQQAKHRPLPDHYVASQFAACTRTCVFERPLGTEFAQSSIMVRRRSSASERLYAASTLLSNVCAEGRLSEIRWIRSAVTYPIAEGY